MYLYIFYRGMLRFPLAKMHSKQTFALACIFVTTNLSLLNGWLKWNPSFPYQIGLSCPNRSPLWFPRLEIILFRPLQTNAYRGSHHKLFSYNAGNYSNFSTLNSRFHGVLCGDYCDPQRGHWIVFNENLFGFLGLEQHGNSDWNLYHRVQELQATNSQPWII